MSVVDHSFRRLLRVKLLYMQGYFVSIELKPVLLKIISGTKYSCLWVSKTFANNSNYRK